MGIVQPVQLQRPLLQSVLQGLDLGGHLCVATPQAQRTKNKIESTPKKQQQTTNRLRARHTVGNSSAQPLYYTTTSAGVTRRCSCDADVSVVDGTSFAGSSPGTSKTGSTLFFVTFRRGERERAREQAKFPMKVGKLRRGGWGGGQGVPQSYQCAIQKFQGHQPGGGGGMNKAFKTTGLAENYGRG